MRMKTWLALALVVPLLVVLLSCSSFPFFWEGGAQQGTSNDTSAHVVSRGRVQVLMQDIRFDGESLSGRFLISAVDQDVSLDKRLIETAYLTTQSVADCASGKPLSFIIMDVYARPPADGDILVLNPGYWYGKDVHIPLFTKSSNEGAIPPCIEVEFAFRGLDGAPLAPLRVRAERSLQLSAEERPSTDAGMNADAGTSTDAGM